MSEMAARLTGKFLVIDGPDGAGKSTQLTRLTDGLRAEGLEVTTTRDPGGTVIGDRIRDILLDGRHGEMAVACETMLYMASRAQLVEQVVRPALAAGRCVLCDRFISATVAYQGAGGADEAQILSVGKVAVGDTWPDLTILLDLDSATGLSRVGSEPDRMEARGLEFHRRVRDGFLRQAKQRPDRYAVVDATGEADEVAQRIRRVLDAWRF